MRLIAAAAALCAFAVVPAHAGDPAPEETEAKEDKSEKAKKICRYVSEMGSRRKTRMCMTAEQWREQNQGE